MISDGWLKERRMVSSSCSATVSRKRGSARSSAEKSFASGGVPDVLFQRYRHQIRSDYQLHDPDLTSLISNGIDQILSGAGDLEKEIADFAYVVRQYMKYRGIDCYDASA